MTQASLIIIGVTDTFKAAMRNAGSRALKFDMCHVLRATESNITPPSMSVCLCLNTDGDEVLLSSSLQ